MLASVNSIPHLLPLPPPATRLPADIYVDATVHSGGEQRVTVAENANALRFASVAAREPRMQTRAVSGRHVCVCVCENHAVAADWLREIRLYSSGGIALGYPRGGFHAARKA